MPIVFGPLAGGVTSVTADGSVFLAGEAFGQQFAANEIYVLGGVVPTGQVLVDVDAGAAVPVVPALIDGTMLVAGYSVLGGSTTANVDGWVDLHGEAYAGSAIEGEVPIHGDANASYTYQNSYGYLVEPQAIIVSYVGQTLGRVVESLHFSTHARRHYTAVALTALHLRSSRRTSFDGAARAADELAFTERVGWVVRMLARSGLTLGALAAGEYRLLARAVSRLILTGQASSYAEALQQIGDALVFPDLVDWMQVTGVTDGLALADRLDHLYAAFAAVIDRLVLAAVPDSTYSLTVVLRDSFRLPDGLSHTAELAAQLADAIGFATTLAFDNGEFIAWVLNTESKGLSRYTNYPFNSFAKVGGRYYGAHSGGIVRLEGDSDDGAPIKARLRLGMFEYGDRRLKSFTEAYVGATGDGQLLLKVIFVEEKSGEKNMAVYKMQPRPAKATRENRFKIGRGIRAVDWDFELENVNGADFDLLSIQFQPLLTSRRTRG